MQLEEIFDIESAYKCLYSEPLKHINPGCWRSLQATISAAVANEGRLKVSYEFDEDNVAKIGRFKAKIIGGCEAAKMPAVLQQREIRAEIFHRNYYDVDMVNCHFYILLQLNIENNIDNPYLINYICDREKMIARFCELLGLGRDAVKTLFIQLLYGGSVKSFCADNKIDSALIPAEIDEFGTAMRKNAQTILDNPKYSKFCDYWTTRNAGKPTASANPLGGKLSTILQTFEREIVCALIDLFKAAGYYVDSIIYDGFHIRKVDANGKEVKKPSDEELLAFQMKAKIATGFDIPLKVKDFERDPAFTSNYIADDRNAVYDKNVFNKVIVYSEFKKLWERFAFKVILQDTYFIRMQTGLMQLSYKSLLTTFAHLSCSIAVPEESSKPPKIKQRQFINMWVRDETIRQYDAAQLIPPPLSCPDSIYNVWDGFAIESYFRKNPKLDPAAGSCEILLKHLWVLLENEQYVNYVLDWMADIIQNPGDKKPVALVLYSAREGTGKNSLCNILKAILGEMYYVETDKPEETLFGTFTKSKENKLLAIINEMNGFLAEKYTETIKNMITENDFIVNDKHEKTYNAISLLRCIFTTNNINSVKISSSDRRFVVLDCKGAASSNSEYFQNLYDSLGRKADVLAFYKYLANRKISLNLVRDRPVTALYTHIRANSTPLFFRFLDGLSDPANSEIRLIFKGTGFCDDDQVKYISQSMFVQRYSEWAAFMNIELKESKLSIARKMREYWDPAFSSKINGFDSRIEHKQIHISLNFALVRQHCLDNNLF